MAKLTPRPREPGSGSPQQRSGGGDDDARVVRTSASAADGTAPARTTAGEVIACHECGTVHRLPAMPNDTVARCTACDAKIYIRFEATVERTLALYLAALALFLVANAFPLLSMAIAGQSNASTILDSAKALYDDGMWPLALAVALAGCVVPLAKILGMLAVLIPLQLERQPQELGLGASHLGFRTVLNRREPTTEP